MSPHLEGITLGREVPAATGHFRWIYLWGWPIRAMHWLAALAIVLLVVTGLYIGKPYFVTSGDTASHYLMGWMRAVHFGAAVTDGGRSRDTWRPGSRRDLMI